jgi:hypothetical protein
MIDFRILTPGMLEVNNRKRSPDNDLIPNIDLRSMHICFIPGSLLNN